LQFGFEASIKQPVRREILICAALLILTLAGFWPVTHHAFINYDDPEYVVGNPAVQSGITVRGILWAFSTTHTGNWIPVTWLSHMFDCEIFGLNSTMHHLVNLLIHAANVVLVFVVLNVLTDSISLFNRAIEVTRDNALAHNNLGDAYAKLGELERAGQHFRKAFEILPRYVSARANYASVLARGGKFEQAEAALTEAIRLEPAYVSAHKILAQVYIREKKTSEALEECLIILNLKPDDAQTRALLDQVRAEAQTGSDKERPPANATLKP
jgi:tetratricopeptide (TPR) repeat protein